MQRCSIIIAAYNEGANLERCLSSLAKIDYPSDHFEVIVVDNNSTDDTKDIVAGYPGVRYLKEEKKGPSNARNLGIQYAGYDIVVFLDADTTVAPDWLKVLIRDLSDTSIGAVGGEIRPIKPGNIISNYLSISLFMRYHRYGGKRDLRGYPSCNLAVRKSLIHDTAFDPALLRGQDKDLCYTILKQGYRIVFQPGAVIYHDHPDSLQALAPYFAKGALARVLLHEKHGSSPDILFFRTHIPLIFIALLAVLAITGKDIAAALLVLAASLFLVANSVAAFALSGRFALSFFVKPVLDIYSIMVTYFYFHLIQIKNNLQKR
ncbi:MAG: glycosyltransferase [Candidatus Omnitrophica bacterium]|nr:glycosyltransferase [Candidatus Omnitrophota bacterium]